MDTNQVSDSKLVLFATQLPKKKNIFYSIRLKMRVALNTQKDILDCQK